MIRRVTRICLFFLALTITVYGVAKIWPAAKKSDSIQYAQKVIQDISNSNTIKNTHKEWTDNEVLTKINDYRTSKGLLPLVLNEKLSNAAKSRLAIINQFNDYDGSQTGLTRDKALGSVGYSYSAVGDLVLVDFFKVNDPIEYWLALENSKETLGNKYIKDAGIAMIQENEQVNLYVLVASPQKRMTATPAPLVNKWGGPELWEAVNKRRLEYGVNPLKKMDDLCTIAAIRLSQIINKGRLDDHEGFVPTLNRDDLKKISEKYNVSEFLVAGYDTVDESVKAWENTLGHKKLLSGGEYVWGCVYAQSGFGVAIAAY